MYALSDEEFEGAISDALDEIPDELVEAFDNVVVLVQDEPDEWQLERSESAPDVKVASDWQAAGDQHPPRGAAVRDERSGDLLGLYDGVNLYVRGNSYGAVDDYPDTITIFKGPHERLSDSREVVLAEVRKTVIHEVGHYFGMDEAQVERMGYA